MKKNESTPMGLYMYLYTFCCFDFYIWHLYFIFCVLPFVLKILSSERFLSFIVFCLLCLTFGILLLSFVLSFCILCFGFGFLHAISMIKKHLSNPTNFGSRQTYRQTIDSVSDMGRRWK